MSRPPLRELILRHAPEHGVAETPVEGLQLIRVSEPVPTVPTTYPASLCLLVQGQKRVYFGGEAQTYDDRSFLCCTMPLPVEGEVPHASPEDPVLGLLLSLDTPAMTETLIAAEAAGGLATDIDSSASTPGLMVSPADEALIDAAGRLLQLLDDLAACRILATSRLREVYFALLRSGAGGIVRRDFGASRGLSRALAYVREHLSAPITVDELARVAGMSKAVFHRRFKAITTLSPLQFIKAMRLNNAAALIAGGMGAAEASARVGYSSASQFSREFSRQYGLPPRQWASAAVPAL